MRGPLLPSLSFGLFSCGVLLVSGCSSDAETAPAPDSCQDGLCLDLPAQGFQMRTEGTDIAAGDDIEFCEVQQLPGEPGELIYVTRFEVAMSEYSHHLIVSAVPLGSSDEANWQVGERIECRGLEAIASQPVTGSQHPYHDEPFPDGVGRTYQGGQKVVFDYHYFNTSSQSVSARAAVNFHTADPAHVTRIADGLTALNITISTPPHETRDFTADCLFNADVMLFKVTRHTHQWGRDFDIWFAGGERDGEHIWTSKDYEDTDYLLPEPVLVSAGEGLRFRCAFENTTDSTLNYGLTATDEMCNLFGMVYAPEDGQATSGQFCLITQ